MYHGTARAVPCLFEKYSEYLLQKKQMCANIEMYMQVTKISEKLSGGTKKGIHYECSITG